jgi:protoheme IX farnesyltransferase
MRNQNPLSKAISPYVALMKLRVVELLLITTVPSLVMAAGKIPSITKSLIVLFAGTLAAGASNAFNMIIERESDRLMARTAKRPVATGEVSETQAFIFASTITVISLLVMAIFINVLATVLTAAAIVIYVFGYTILLKRRTPQNIVWGGIAGCMPVLIGFAAIENKLPLAAWAFFFVVFFWTPPHFWALAIKYRGDYEAAGIPMLPVVAPLATVLKQMWGHTIAMTASSILLFASIHTHWWGWIVLFFISANFLRQVFLIRGEAAEKAAIRLFHGSITYLTVVSVLLIAVVLIK